MNNLKNNLEEQRESVLASVSTGQKILVCLSILSAIIVVVTGSSLAAWVAWFLTAGLFFVGLSLQLLVYKLEQNAEEPEES